MPLELPLDDELTEVVLPLEPEELELEELELLDDEVPEPLLDDELLEDEVPEPLLDDELDEEGLLVVLEPPSPAVVLPEQAASEATVARTAK